MNSIFVKRTSAHVVIAVVKYTQGGARHQKFNLPRIPHLQIFGTQ